MAKILIVEDSPGIQKVYQTVLTHEGYDVISAVDGKEALSLALNSSPDLILLDLLMAKMGGLEFLRTFDLAKHPGTKAIVFSNLASSELIDEAKELGATRYLMKSNFTPQELLDAVKAALAEANPVGSNPAA